MSNGRISDVRKIKGKFAQEWVRDRRSEPWEKPPPKSLLGSIRREMLGGRIREGPNLSAGKFRKKTGRGPIRGNQACVKTMSDRLRTD